MKILTLTFFFIASFLVANGQVNVKSNDLLLMTPTKFKLQATKVVYLGENCSPSEKTDKAYSDLSEVIRINDNAFYQANRFSKHGRGDGLVVENFSGETCRIYPMFGLAETAGWFKRKGNDGGMPNATRGLYRVGNTLWMGSNGIGAAVFDLETSTWSRYDLKSNVEAGDHLSINYADNDYVFVTRGEFPGASLHIYNVKQKKWLGLKAVSTKLVSEYGYTTGLVQVPVDHRFFAGQKYIPIDWTFMGLEVTDKGNSYLFENKFSETKTVFEIDKLLLERVFRKGS